MRSSDHTNPKKPLSDEDHAIRMNLIDQAANHSLLSAVLRSVAAGQYNTETRNMLVVILRTLKQHELANTIIELPPRTFIGPPVDWQLAALQRYLEREIERINHLRQNKNAVRRNGSNN